MADVILYWTFAACFWLLVALWALRAVQFICWFLFGDE